MESFTLGGLVVSPALAWLAIGILLIAMEAVVPGFVIFWFGAGALATALAVALGMRGFAAELLVFLGVSLGSLLLWHLVLRKRFPGSGAADGRDATITELRGKVTRRIAPEAEGEVELATAFHGLRSWKARSDEALEVGEDIEVIEARGIALVVTRRRS
jgi:membrane protein implicated in regulation of membrane protease activity